MVGRPAQLLRGRRTPRGRAAGGRGRTGGGGGCSGPRPAATIPPAALAAESRGRRCAGSPAGTPGVSPLGTAPAGGLGRGGTVGSALRPRLWLRDASRAEAPPRAGKLLPVASTPSPPFLAPARRAPLSSSPHSSPSLPFPAPARLPHGPLTARRGGPSSAPRGDRPETGGRGHPGGSRFRRTWRPELGPKSRGGVCRAILAVGPREGGRARSMRGQRLLGVAEFKGAGGIMQWQSGLPSQSSARPRDGGTGACYCEESRSMGNVARGGTPETHSPLFKVLPLTRIPDWSIRRYYAFFLSRYAGSFRKAKQIKNRC